VRYDPARGLVNTFHMLLTDKDDLQCLLMLERYKRLCRINSVILSVSEAKNIVLLEYILARGADPNTIDSAGYTPLTMAANVFWHQKNPQMYEASPECIKILLRYGAKTGIERDKSLAFEWTALHFAAYSGNLEGARVLYEYGVDLKSKGDEGETPLHVACDEGSTDVAEFIAQINPAMLDETDMAGHTPMDLAREKNYTELVERLISIKKRTS